MPVFEVELSDGTVVDIEGPRQPTQEEALELIKKTPRVGRAEAFGIGAARSVLPSAAFAAGASVGGPVGAEIGSGGGPIGVAVGAGIGSLLLGGGLAAAAEFGQDAVLKKYLPKDTYEKLTAETAAAQAQHPGFSEAGGIAGMLPSFEIAPLKVAQLPFRAALGATVGAVQPLATGRAPSTSDVLGGAAAMTLFGKPRSAFEGIESLTKKGIGYATQKRIGKENVPVERPGDGQGGTPGEAGVGGGLQPEAGLGQEAPLSLTPVLPQAPWAERAKAARTTPHQIALEELEAKGWDIKWPFVPADLENKSFRDAIASDPNLAQELKDRILSFAPGGKNALGVKVEDIPQRMTPGERAQADVESQRYEEAERAAIAEAESQGAKVKVVKEAPPEDENVPFAAGQFMRPNEQGGIDIHQPNFRSWVRNTLSRLPPEQQRQAIAARIDEELRHIQVIKALGGLGKANASMASFWNDLTGFEKRLEHRSYTGFWTPEELGQTLSDSELGHEVVRRRMQKLATGTTSETAETVGVERWTVKGINALSDMVYKARQTLGTKASARQRAVWDKILENLEVAKEVASAGAAPGARERGKPEHFESLPWEIGVPVWKSLVNAGEKYGDQPTGDNVRSAMIRLATTPQSQWPLPEGLKDQVQQWFRDQQGGRWDRLRLINDELEDVARKGSELAQQGDPSMVDSIIRLNELGQLRRDVQKSQNSGAADWYPAARERGRTPEDWERIRQEQAARRRGTKQAYEPEQEKMFGIEQMGKTGQVPGEEPPVVQPISTAEAGALPAIPIDQELRRVINSDDPSFHNAVTSVQHNVAGYATIQEPQLVDKYQDALKEHLEKASGARVEELLKNLQLESKLNPALRKLAGVRGVPQPRRIPDEYTPASDKERRLAQAAEAMQSGQPPDLVRIEQDRKQIELGQRLRRHALAEIWTKLVGEARPLKGLNRTEIVLGDIDFQNARADAYHRFAPREATDPDAYEHVLSDRARPNKWSSLTKTKRLAVLVNKRTGEVDIVGAYKHGRQGIEIVDPTALGIKEHYPISNYLGRYRLHASMLLTDPVQFFHQRIGKLSDYENAIGKIAEQRAKVAELDEAGESMTERGFMSNLFPGEEVDAPEGFEHPEEEPAGKFQGPALPAGVTETEDVRAAEAPPGVGEAVRGEGGMMMGPEAGAARGMMGIGKGFERGRELLPTEANALREFVEGAVGKVESKEDLTRAINKLIELGKLEKEPRVKLKPVEPAEPPTFPPPELGRHIPIFTGQARKAVDAIRKAARLILLENNLRNRGLKPEERTYLTSEQAYEKALDHFYEALTTTENPADYTQKALRRFAGLVRQDVPAKGIVVPGAAQGQAKGIARELAMRERVPPTVARGPTGEPIYGTQPAPARPEGRPAAPIPPEMLPEGAAPVEAKAGPPAELGTPIMEQPKATGKGLYYPKLKAVKREGGVPFYPTEAGQPEQLPQELKQAWLDALGKAPGARQRKSGQSEREFLLERIARLQTQVNLADLRQDQSKKDYWTERIRLDKERLKQLEEGESDEQSFPGAFNRAAAKKVMERTWEDFKDTLKGTIPDFKAVTSRSFTMKDLFAYKQGARNTADDQALKLGEMIRLASFEGEATSRAAKAKALMVRRAVSAVIAARAKDAEGNLKVKPPEFTNLLNYVEVGRRKGEELLKYSKDPKVRKYARKIIDTAAQYKEEVEYARDHWDDADMTAAVWAFDTAMSQHRDAMNAAGFQIAAKENFVPGRYLGELFMDNTITFGPNKILGLNFGRPKTFDSKYAAFANPSKYFGKERRAPGTPQLVPYISVNNDTAVLAQHSIARGLHLANDQQWMEWLRSQKDPASGMPIAVKPKLVRGTVEGEDPDTGEIVNKSTLVPRPPSPDYVIVRSTPSGPAMAIREGYRRAVEMALAPSRIEEFPVLREAHRIASMLKHGLILMLDTFHVARLGQYSLALGAKDWGKSFGWKRGISALTWNEGDLPEAVAKGLVSKEDAAWAMEKMPVYNVNGGVKRYETRAARINEAMRRGLNAATNADTLYRNAIQNLPFIGEPWSKLLTPANKLIFDKITPGMIAESFTKNFERLHKANPKIPYDDLMRDVIRDTNVFYGNLGRQGFFRGATFRDLASIVVLAPLWREGLLRKEAMFWSRVSGLSYLTGRRGMGFNNYLGTLGRGVAAGLGAWFAAAQVINLISKGKPTWENEEDDHKLDAWIPTPKGGVWISTLGVFAELTHDLWRLAGTKPKTWDAVTQVGENALGPMGRMAAILATGKSPTGQQYTTTAGVLKGAGSELMPTPISLATPLKLAGVGQPLRPGELLQRGLATLTGTKSTLATRPSQDIQHKAEKWLRSEGLKYEPMTFTPTDAASYAKLRGAVRNDDIKGARKVLEELRKHKTDAQILHALKTFSRHPFTGTLKNERMFLYSLDDKDLDLYQRATQEKFETYEKAADLVLSQ